MKEIATLLIRSIFDVSQNISRFPYDTLEIEWKMQSRLSCHYYDNSIQQTNIRRISHVSRVIKSIISFLTIDNYNEKKMLFLNKCFGVNWYF